jgi:glyoxylase-like metal-dependent hydrolase (beta-lactamase superfamily II)
VQFQAPLWQTNSLLVVTGNEAILFDPGVLPVEIETIRSETARRGCHAVRLLITHADFDHVCGIPYFPGAEVACGESTAHSIRSGEAAQGLRDAELEWAAGWSDDLHVDRVIAEGADVTLGASRIEAIGAPSHGRDGLAYVVLEQGVLVTGDHISAVTYPALHGPFSLLRQANERLLEALDRHELRWVVPGHGPALRPAEATAICEADLSYLDRLGAAAREAIQEGLAPGYALLHVYAVEPPRPTTPDFEIYQDRAGNARRLLAQM